jgi:hypothetical protein
MFLEMFPFCLYFITGIITGFHVYTLMLLSLYGVPINPLEFVSLLGSLCLLIAAYLSLFKPRAAAKLALLASLSIWCFYAPALAKSIRTRLDKPSSVSFALRPPPAIFSYKCGPNFIAALGLAQTKNVCSNVR